VWLAAATGDDGAPAGVAARMAPYVAAPWMLMPFLLRVLIYGPVPEELGWRGYALDRLQARYSALSAALILGTIWAAWHLPLFFIDGMDPHHSAGVGSRWFWLFMLQVVALSVVYSRVFNGTRRSTLAAILLHVMNNVSAELMNATAATNLYATLLWVGAAAVIAVSWRPGRVGRAAA
jgi:membrane protease YdiL (CAAX protease family)